MGNTFTQSTSSFRWVVCELSNLRSNFERFFRKFDRNIKNKDFENRDKIDRFQSRIAQLTGHPQKWFCTFLNPKDNIFQYSIISFQWVVCGLSNSRSNFK